MSEATPPAQAQGHRRSELTLRVMSSVVLGIIALGSAYVAGAVFAVVWALAAGAVAYEWVVIVSPGAPASLRIAAPAGIVAAGLLSFAAPAPGLAVLAISVVAALVLEPSSRARPWIVAGMLYAAVLAVIPTWVRGAPHLGLGAILWMFAVVWATDIAGYFAGRSLGGPRLWPRVSPKKTWSGFVGGTVAGAAAATLVGLMFWESSDRVMFALAGAAASIAAQAGDLGESALKRHFGVKNSSNLIPGHGGFMDRLDGFWAVSLIAGLGLAVHGTLRTV